jgi:hypothetical protein
MVKVKRITNKSIQSLGSEWHLLAEVVVTGEPEQKLVAVDQVIETVEAFQLSAQRKEQLKTAVTRAVMSEVKLFDQDSGRSCVAQPPVSIRIMASPQAVDSRSSSDETGASGWGFFLIEKMAADDWLQEETCCHMIELFLYLEGEIQSRKKEK